MEIDELSGMSQRTSKAIVVGIILGCISGYFLGNAGYLALFFLLFGGALPPLIVYRIADPSAIWVSVMPNIIMIPVAVVVE